LVTSEEEEEEEEVEEEREEEVEEEEEKKEGGKGAQGRGERKQGVRGSGGVGAGGTELRRRLAANTARFRARMTSAGFDLGGGGDHPIVPVMLGDAALATEMADQLLTQHGVYVVGFSYPVVPRGKARIRVQLSAAHTEVGWCNLTSD